MGEKISPQKREDLIVPAFCVPACQLAMPPAATNPSPISLTHTNAHARTQNTKMMARRASLPPRLPSPCRTHAWRSVKSWHMTWSEGDGYRHWNEGENQTRRKIGHHFGLALFSKEDEHWLISHFYFEGVVMSVNSHEYRCSH